MKNYYKPKHKTFNVFKAIKNLRTKHLNRKRAEASKKFQQALNDIPWTTARGGEPHDFLVPPFSGFKIKLKWYEKIAAFVAAFIKSCQHPPIDYSPKINGLSDEIMSLRYDIRELQSQIRSLVLNKEEEDDIILETPKV